MRVTKKKRSSTTSVKAVEEATSAVEATVVEEAAVVVEAEAVVETAVEEGTTAIAEEGTTAIVEAEAVVETAASEEMPEELLEVSGILEAASEYEAASGPEAKAVARERVLEQLLSATHNQLSKFDWIGLTAHILSSAPIKDETGLIIDYARYLTKGKRRICAFPETVKRQVLLRHMTPLRANVVCSSLVSVKGIVTPELVRTHVHLCTVIERLGVLESYASNPISDPTLSGQLKDFLAVLELKVNDQEGE